MADHSDAANYCLCNSGGDSAFQKNIDYACGAGADCSAILQNGACFNPNTAKDHCNYAVNSYYQRKGQTSGSCDFSGTAKPPLMQLLAVCIHPIRAEVAQHRRPTRLSEERQTRVPAATQQVQCQAQLLLQELVLHPQELDLASQMVAQHSYRVSLRLSLYFCPYPLLFCSAQESKERQVMKTGVARFLNGRYRLHKGSEESAFISGGQGENVEEFDSLFWSGHVVPASAALFLRTNFPRTSWQCSIFNVFLLFVTSRFLRT